MFLMPTTLFYKLLFVVGVGNYLSCRLVQTKLSSTGKKYAEKIQGAGEM